MAKRKQAAALFEVIHADNRFPKRHAQRPWSLSAPKWWSSRKTKSARKADDDAPSGPSWLTRLFNLVPPIPRIGLTLDPERQIVRFQLSYTGAIVSAFTLCVAMGLAYAVGRQGSHRPTPALAEKTTEDLRAGPANADVLDIHADAPPVALASEPVPAAARTQPTASHRTPTTQTASVQGVRPSWTEPRGPATLVVTDSNRTVGLQYVIVQSYPVEEKQWAEGAMKVLNEAGVLCTIEKGIPWAPSSYCVVGVTGFDRTRNSPAYDAYIARIRQVSDKFAGTVRFKKFDPKPFRWRETKPDAAR
jgi:hypothetical protein